MLAHAALFAVLACPPSSLEPPAEDAFIAGPSWFWATPESPAELPEREAFPLPLPTEFMTQGREAAWEALFEAHMDGRVESPEVRASAAHWLGWALADSLGLANRAHAQLVLALSAEALEPAAFSWWWRSSSGRPGRLDALLDTWERTEPAASPSARALLARAVALELWRRSCPARTLGPDRSCATADGLPLRRDPVAVERARAWTELARTLDDPGPLSAALELAAATPDYEALLAARMPEELAWEVEEWRADSGVPEWEALYLRQRERGEVHRSLLRATVSSAFACSESVAERDTRALENGPELSAVVALRRARLLLHLVELAFPSSTREHRRLEREDAESRARTGRWARSWTHPPDEPWTELAVRELERCVAGPVRELAVLDACHERLASLGGEGDVQAEIIPKPTLSMQLAGVQELQREVRP
ncbi:hypothetical protein PPSIR1_10910 [Plesiocystis pacifica SIR-1]|uniref:Uncharacterized protein n=1 Tax=Plesiocystis pacifica SIR-1 TaxID=391625 RepID=A6G516_9BACT|nr:hypothetical protein [Plesiocystis pacifica]EDM79108.1 hypothetical protein PPSIR1_10910 [Plesiocystis pacifica SIR-1]